MNKCFIGDCREVMKKLITDGAKMQTCVTSPPYWGLRDYGHPGQLGLEKTPEEYVSNMVEVFRLVRDLLADDGTLWLNLGDSYNGSGKGGVFSEASKIQATNVGANINKPTRLELLKPKDLIGIPWRVAFTLQADGWYLRSDIIWAKPNPMPESVKDRPTRSHEYIFLMSKKAKYFYDAESIMERAVWDINGDGIKARKSRANMDHKSAPSTMKNGIRPLGFNQDKQRGHSRRHAGFNDRWDHMTKQEQAANGRNKRDVWTFPTNPYPGAHFATFPPALIEPCILAGSRVGDIVLDPFFGSGTTGEVAERLGRQWIGIELNEKYIPLQLTRTMQASFQI